MSGPLCGCSADGSCLDPQTRACEGPGPGTVQTRCGPGRTACPAEPAPGRTPAMGQADTACSHKTWTPPGPHVELRGWGKRTAWGSDDSRETALQHTWLDLGLGASQDAGGTTLLVLCRKTYACLGRRRVGGQ